MGVKLSKNRKKSFDKKKVKAQDEVVQIKRSEWEEMQEAVSKVQGFMEDLVDGNLEIEIIDDEDETNEEDVEDVEEEEVDPDVEEIEIEEEEADPEAEVDPDVEEMEIETDDEKADDEDFTETLKDPVKRKAVLDFLKLSATDKAEDMKEEDSADKAEDEKELDEKEDEEKKKVGDKKIKREIKRKTLQKKAADVAIPDFTSRFRDDVVEPVKGADEKVDELDASEKFRNRFN